MKKICMALCVTALILSMAATAFAAGRGLGRMQGRNFVDADNDGICDNMGKGRNFVDANNDGICDNMGKGRNFVDANNDGVCDNMGKGCMRGRNFVDADNDGVCDNRAGMRRGLGRGWRGGRGQ